jgi:hypothetical protein
MKIAAKEAYETDFWLELCNRSKQYPDCIKLQEKNAVILRILNKIIGTSKSNNK